MYIERDTRKQTMGKSDMQHMDYLSRCLELLIVNLIDMVPNISSRSLKYHCMVHNVGTCSTSIIHNTDIEYCQL